jgi:hypothetical protein
MLRQRNVTISSTSFAGFREQGNSEVAAAAGSDSVQPNSLAVCEGRAVAELEAAPDHHVTGQLQL